jgi:HPt (histidine-containing phosphotransfer) domain-containing protein
MATEFDHAQLEAITGGDTEFEREVLEEYLNSAPADVAKVAAAVNAADAGALARAAHALKGASATIGAKGFAAIALELEHAGKAGTLGDAPAALGRLQSEFSELEQFLRTRIAKAA